MLPQKNDPRWKMTALNNDFVVPIFGEEGKSS